jgi:hypothetical protein
VVSMHALGNFLFHASSVVYEIPVQPAIVWQSFPARCRGTMHAPAPSPKLCCGQVNGALGNAPKERGQASQAVPTPEAVSFTMYLHSNRQVVSHEHRQSVRTKIDRSLEDGRS